MTEARVENQLFRFTPASTLDPQRVIDEIGGKRSGRYVTLSLVAPRATLLIDQEGKIIVHGCRKQDLAHLAAKEVLLRLGEDESGMTFEVGPVVASFDFESTVSLEGVPDLFLPLEVVQNLCVGPRDHPRCPHHRHAGVLDRGSDLGSDQLGQLLRPVLYCP